MERALVVVDDTDAHRTLLREAGELAAGTGAELLLLSMVTEEEYEESFETIETIAESEGTSYGEGTVLESVRKFAREIAQESLDDIDVEYEARAAVVEEEEQADEIIRTADENDCDHVFIVGRKRSPTGKALFGDTAQAVILNFDGPVTIRTS